MTSPIESRLRDALDGVTVDCARVQPLIAPAPRRGRVPLRLRRVPLGLRLAAATGAVVLVAGGVFAAFQAGHRDYRVVPAGVMDEALAEGLRPDVEDIVVYLCKERSPFPACRARGAATAGRKAAIERSLKAMPQVKSVTFQSREDAYREFMRGDNDSELKSAIRAEDMPESFRLRLRPGTDGTAVVRAARSMPGVSNVFDLRCAFIPRWLQRC